MKLLPSSTKGLILDMDGVIWTDSAPIGNLPLVFETIIDSGMKVALATNNSSRTIDQYVARLHNFGVTVEPWQIVTSSQAAAEQMASQLPAGCPVFAIGHDGLVEELTKKGFEVLPVEGAEKAQAVVIGIDWEINFAKMREATLLVRAGKPFYATNPDKTFPTPRGQIPGAGAWISVITTATGVEPTYAGKPYPYILELALNRLGTPREFTYVVGDRLETDIAGGQNINCPTALVLSGVSSKEEGEKWSPAVNIIAEDLSALVGCS